MTKTKKNREQPALFADDKSPPLPQDAAKLWGVDPAGKGCPDMIRRQSGSDVRAAAKPDADLTDEKLAAVVGASLFTLKGWELRATARLIADFTCPRW